MSDQQPVEMILLRQLASYLTVPMWMMDAAGNLIFYNEPAEKLLGVNFDEAGPVQADDLADLFQVTDLDGRPLPDEEVPIVKALTLRIPAHKRLRFRGFDGAWREVEVSALPVEGQGGRFLGAYAAFWEVAG